MASAVGLRTPLAAGNVAGFADRWALIDSDTLPTFLRLLDRPAEDLRAELETPVGERVGRWRTARRLPGSHAPRCSTGACRSSRARRRRRASRRRSTSASPGALAAGGAPVTFTSAAVEGAPLRLLLPDARSVDVHVRQVLTYASTTAGSRRSS